MKKYIYLIALSAVTLFVSCTNNEVNGVFEQVSDRVITVKAIEISTPLCSTTVNNVPVTITGNVYTCVYMVSGDTVLVEFQDSNSGSIQNGDTIRFNDVKFTTCGFRQQIRTDNYSLASVFTNSIEIYYTDCMLPLNGTNGSILMKLKP